MAVPRRPISIAAAAATAVVLGATALALPASASTAASDTLGTGSTSDTPGAPGTGSAPGTGGASQADKSAPAAPYKLKEGTLEWGFKESFRGYVLKSQGTVEVSDGAKQAAGNGVFTFVDGVGTYDMGKHAVTTAFKGTVRFQAPQRFTLQIADVKLVTEGKGGSIKADVTLDGVTMNDVDLASLDLTDTKPEMGQGGAMAFKGIPAKLTADGAKAFNGMYKAGDALDAATLTVKVDAGPPPKPDPEKPDPENPGKPDPENPGKPDPENPEKPDPENPKPENPGKPDGTAGTILDGNLDWGVKESFREYVTTGFGKGKIEVSGGTTSNAAGFRFPKGKGVFDASKKSLSASFDGQVRFLGHLTDGQYVLDLKLSDLKVKVEGTKGTLLADVSTKDRETQKVSTFNDLGIASLAVPANALKAEKKVVTLNDVPATLTADGVKAFGGMYQAGIALDKVDVAVSLDKDVTLPGASNGGSSSGGSGGSASGGSGGSGGSSTGGSSVAGGGGTVGGGGSVGGSLAATGSDVPTTALLAASAGIAAAGAGVIYAARRRKATES
ncbi:HtaA domain-containing protein [Streptomyces sp. NPDC004726]